MTSYKKLIFTIFLASFMLGEVVIPRPADAQFADVIGGPTTIVKYIWEKVEKVYDAVQSIVGSELSNRTVSMFLDSLAYDVATELAQGGPGGKPQFRTVSIKKALQNSQDKALGEFLGELTTKGFDELGINLCNPSLELKLTLTLGLIDEEKPPRPKCDWARAQKNWQKFDDNLQADIIKFQLDTKQSGATSTVDFFKGLVSKESSDLRQAFELEAEVNRRKLEAEKALELSTEECQGFLDKKTPITEEVITHCSVNYGMARDAFTNATQIEAQKQLAKKQAADNKKLSDILKDAGNKFLDTFTSKLMKNWIKKGMWSLFGSTENDIYQDYRNTLIDRLRGGADVRQPRGADIFKDLVTINVETIDDFDYLNDFTICPNEFRSPDNCVMSPAFLQAVNNKLTIKQAVDQGIIDGNISFVHPDDHQNHTIDKCYRDGLCYANLVKLRKANIVPVGWELAALRAPVSIQQAMNCFEEKPADDPTKCEFDVSPEFAVGGNDHNPFYHLVDPNWVLKAPEVRCDAYSFSSILQSPEGSNRQKYCADPKVCLREDADGKCIDEQYNYCTRTENSWNFEGQACAGGATYAGCLTFANKEFGNNSYIQDTLEYCNSNQAGCRRYSPDKNGAGDWVLEDIASDDNDLFLNNQSAECSQENAGCSEYIVMSLDTGTNLVPNGSFDDLNSDGFPDGWTNFDNLTPADGIDDPMGANNTNNVPLDYDGNRLPNGYHVAIPADRYSTTEVVQTKVLLRPNTSYLLSVDGAQYDDIRNDRVRVILHMCDDETGCDEAITPADSVDNLGSCYFNIGGHRNNVDLIFFPEDTDMQKSTCSFLTNDFVDYAILELIGIVGNYPAPAPPVNLAAVWFDNLKVEAISDRTADASTYSAYGEGTKIYMDDSAVMCSADEVGCQGYLPANGDPMIPAVIVQDDLCPAECIGYDTFTEQPNVFDIIEGNNFVEYYNFIADTAKQCPDQEVGCEEFTNLDVVAEGGEGREYFTYLRQCVSPALGATYYTWEGSEVAGYQIKTWNALPSNLGAIAPCTNMAPAGDVCLDAPLNIANCGPDTPDPSDDPDNDPNCREFFDIDGNVSYRLQDRVIFATDNCHDYRRTLTDQIYKAVPEESITCAEANNGCSSYYGNNSNNIRLVVSDNFEQGTYAPWRAMGAGSLDLSTEALNNNGHSLRAQTGRLFVRDMKSVRLQNNKEYTISWWMKSESVLDTFSLNLWGNDLAGNSFIETFADSDVDSNFQNIEPGRWHYYTASTYLDDLDLIDANFIDQLEFQIETTSALPDQGLYIDNFIVKEVQNSFAVIRNSWNTPLSCDSPYEGYHLGCQAYSDLNGQEFNLKSFDRLCREEAIGCMPVIDTNNSRNADAEVFHSGDYSEITVDEDKVVYLVPNPNNYCPQEAKGCTALGLPDRLDDTQFSTVYKINDPDKYNSILCDGEGLNCSEYNTSKGISYLKDPGLQTCTYQQNVLIDNNLLSGWFKTTNLGDEVPLGCADTDGDPYASPGLYDVSELILPQDYCSVSETNPTQVFYFTKDDCQQNGGYWNNYLMAGQCPNSEDSCTIFKDPVDPIACDPKGHDLNVGDVCTSNLYDDEATCEANGFDWVLESKDGYCNSAVYNNEKDCVDNGWQWTPYCQEYYYYDNSSIDEAACNGQVDRQNGCVLFYDANNWNGEHSQVINLYDTEETYEDVEASNLPASPVTCDPSFDPTCQLTSNRLIKVIKDRQCAEWLACKSSVASFDKDTEEYKIICDDLDTCLEFQYDPDSNTTKCKKWGSYDDDVEALTFEKYQSRDTGLRNHIAWSDKEYTGYSIPNSLPVSELVVYDFGPVDNQMSRLAYDIVNRSDAEGSYYSDCVDLAGNSLDGQSCTATINREGDYYFRGECQDRVCWVGPLANANSTSTYAIETRAYSVADSPFPSAIEPKGIERLSKYKGANICTNNETSPNACELSFKKVTFGGGQETHYYPEYTDAGDIPTGICVSGITFEENAQQTPKECSENRDCDSYDDLGNKRGDGRCARRTEEIVFRNWPGICLEYDLSSPITKDGSNSYYCNQWYPAQKIKGTASLYDNYRDSGYYDPAGRDALFCAVAEPYITNEDRFYCGYFTGANECNVLLRVPAGSQVDLNLANQYSELLDEGSWMNWSQGLITPAASTAVRKDIIVTASHTKFLRTDFGNVLPAVSNFMDIINNMFDAPAGIHRFYWDQGVSATGASSGAFVWIPGSSYTDTNSQCEDCPGVWCPANYHPLRQTCSMGGHCGWHRWRHSTIWCNPLLHNYYVDINAPVGAVPIPIQEFVGSCAADCRFVNALNEDANHGRGCFQDNGLPPRAPLAPTYRAILTSYASSTLPGGFDVNACIAAINDNDCNFVSCIQTLPIVNQNITHSCNEYESCFQYILDIDGNLIASAGLQTDVTRCVEEAWDVAKTVYDASEYNNCLLENQEDFRDRRSGEVDDVALAAFCSSCVLEPLPVAYNSVSTGINCDEVDAINCYQQCRIVTHLDSEGLLSAVRTDIWWRSDITNQRISQAFPWVSWYADPVRGYVTSTETPSASDDEVLYHSIALYPNPTGNNANPDLNYPNNFSHFGAGLDTFDPDFIVATRVPYYRVSPDNITAGTFFSYFDDNVETLADAVDRAQLQMQDIFFRVYNLNWSSASSTYQYYAETDLAGGNHSNPFAGPDYSPRILATCGDKLCETVDSNGNVIGVEQGITINGVTGGTLIGLAGSLFTNTKFFYHAHPDHMPVYSVDADWGDGMVNNFSLNPGKYKNSLPADYCNSEIDAPGDANPITPGREPQLMGFAGEDRACQPGYKVFYHDYLYDDTRNHDCNGTASGAPGTPAKPVIPNASCYQPRIRVMDNWGWFRVVPFDGWIVVYEE